MQHVCHNCNKTFDSPYRKAKCCSTKCAGELQSKRRFTEKTCILCGKLLEKPGQMKLRYCSGECRDSDPNRVVIDNIVHTTCKHCEKQFTHPNWRTLDYCSRECADLSHKTITIVQSTCEYCNESFEHRSNQPRRFCTKACWHKFGVGKNNPCWKSVEVECANCHKIFNREPIHASKNTNQFCSAKCNGEYYSRVRVGPDHHLWKGGAYSNRGKGWYTQRRLAWIRDNYTCQACGKTRKQTGKKPHVHHIVPFRLYGLDRAEEANQLTNLVCLCYSCHMKAEYGLITFQLPLI